MFYGELYFKRGDFEKAFDYLHQSIETYDVYHDPFGTGRQFHQWGFFKEKNNPDSVIFYAKKGLDASHYKPVFLITVKFWLTLYETINPKLALDYLKMQLGANDLLYGAQKIQELQKTLSEQQQQEQQIKDEQIEKQRRSSGKMVFLAGLLASHYYRFYSLQK